MSNKRTKGTGRVVRKQLADGSVRIYRYGAWKPKPAHVSGDSLVALIRAWRRSPRWEALSPHTQKNYSIYLRPFEDLGHLSVPGFSKRDVADLYDMMVRDHGAGAAAGFLRVASALFKWAVKRDWIAQSPVRDIETVDGGHLTAWTAEQADRAIVGLPEHLRRLVVLARYTGQRRADLCAMRWAAYDGHSIALTQQKTLVKLAIPCHPVLKAELDEWRQGATALTILTNKWGRPMVPKNVSNELPRSLVKLGLPPGLNVHGLRKLAATELAQAGCSTHEIAAITGHKTLAMVQLYTDSVSQERLAQSAVDKVVRLQPSYNQRKLRGGN